MQASLILATLARTVWARPSPVARVIQALSIVLAALALASTAQAQEAAPEAKSRCGDAAIGNAQQATARAKCELEVVSQVCLNGEYRWHARRIKAGWRVRSVSTSPSCSTHEVLMRPEDGQMLRLSTMRAPVVSKDAHTIR